MRTNKYYAFYKKWIIAGKIPNYGLCNTHIDGELLSLFEPTELEKKKIKKDNMSTMFWGHGISYDEIKEVGEVSHSFTPLRQNIVLFMAAMAGEL